jgi:hypothetical protein
MAQARDWRGRWTSGGGFSGKNSTTIAGVRHKEVTVTRLKKGVPVRPGRIGVAQATNRIGKAGSPIGGNKNVRHVSRTSAVLRTQGYLSPAGRAFSARAVRSASPPKHGYIVQYSPRK